MHSCTMLKIWSYEEFQPAIEDHAPELVALLWMHAHFASAVRNTFVMGAAMKYSTNLFEFKTCFNTKFVFNLISTKFSNKSHSLVKWDGGEKMKHCFRRGSLPKAWIRNRLKSHILMRSQGYHSTHKNSLCLSSNRSFWVFFKKYFNDACMIRNDCWWLWKINTRHAKLSVHISFLSMPELGMIYENHAWTSKGP
jgi:hypothetical protein